MRRYIAAVAVLLSAMLIVACGGSGSGPGFIDAGDTIADIAADSRQDETTDDVAVDSMPPADTGTDVDEPLDTATPPDTNAPPDTTEPQIDCSVVANAELPLPFTTLHGFSGSEDFAFDAEGNLVSNDDGNLTRETKNNDERLFSPNIGETAGTRFLPDGDLVIADVDDSALVRVAPNGARATILGGLAYPNGLDIDRDGTIYVAEQDANRLRRVDPVTGEFKVLSENLVLANGVSFGPDYQRLYVGSFGAATVWVLERDDSELDGWGEAREFAKVPPESDLIDPNDPAATYNFCEGAAVGDACITGAYNAGSCQIADDNVLRCDIVNSIWTMLGQACIGQFHGAPCTIELGHDALEGSCFDFGGGQTFCEVALSRRAACEDKVRGQGCFSLDFGVPAPGECVLTFGGSLRCSNLGFEPGGERGGLDGVQVDACGYVYVTEFVEGLVWRISPDGQHVEKAADLPSGWIPNLHFGRGVGGWDLHTLYVMDRDDGRVFELPIGVPGKDAPTR